MQGSLTSIELCAGAGGQALGIEQAGFSHEALVEVDDWCRKTLVLNRPKWNVVEGEQADLTKFNGRGFEGIDLVAGGVPCPPFSKAGRQLGAADERDLFPEALRVVDEVRPKAVMLENVRGFMDAVFHDYRQKLKAQLKKMRPGPAQQGVKRRALQVRHGRAPALPFPPLLPLRAAQPCGPPSPPPQPSRA